MTLFDLKQRKVRDLNGGANASLYRSDSSPVHGGNLSLHGKTTFIVCIGDLSLCTTDIG